ncbi:DUF4387 domain-containing protein [Blastomonas sp.]|uniref:DUF4387 domain-containing protein n=1 Tax=Blastomonas sp. TaxID=1909299 RepID=UPI00406A6CA3
MAKVRDVCRHLRSKQAGPFWVTVDIFFSSPENFARYHDSLAFSPDAFGVLFGTDPAMVKRVPVENLSMVKISYPRATPQGGKVERDMHSGQQYVRLLDIELS